MTTSRLTLTDSVSCTSSTCRALSMKSINSTSSSDDSGVLEARSKITWNSLQILSKKRHRHCVLLQLVLINCRTTRLSVFTVSGSCRYPYLLLYVLLLTWGVPCGCTWFCAVNRTFRPQLPYRYLAWHWQIITAASLGLLATARLSLVLSQNIHW